MVFRSRLGISLIQISSRAGFSISALSPGAHCDAASFVLLRIQSETAKRRGAASPVFDRNIASCPQSMQIKAHTPRLTCPAQLQLSSNIEVTRWLAPANVSLRDLNRRKCNDEVSCGRGLVGGRAFAWHCGPCCPGRGYCPAQSTLCRLTRDQNPSWTGGW